LCCGSALKAQLLYETVKIDYDSAAEYKNLRIIPIRKKPTGGGAGSPVISFSKALESGVITLSERGTASTENVHWLRINNNSGTPVFIASGEVVVGGRQDRMITKDTLISSSPTDQYIPVMCVEEGRWSEKARKFTYAKYANPKLRRVLDQSRNQLLIWKEIYGQLDSNNVKSPTLSYAANRSDKKFTVIADDYLRYFSRKFHQNDSSIIGFVCMSGDKIMGSDIFDNPALFYDQFQALISGYIEQAINFGSPNRITDTQVKTYLDQFLVNEISQQSFLKKYGKIYRSEGKVFHITSY
jgi:hypothetical protein